MGKGEVRCNLGDVLTLEYGRALPERTRSGSGYPVVGSAGIVGHHDEYLVAGPAVVVGRKGTAGAVLQVDDSCWPIDTTYYAKVRDGCEVDLPFVRLLLEDADLPRIATAAGVPGLNRDRAYELPVAIPPVAEQRRIVDLVDAARRTLLAARLGGQRAKSMLGALTRDLCPVHVDAATGTPLSELAQYINGRAFRPQDFTAEGLPVIRIQQLRDPAAACDRYGGPLDDRNLIVDGDLIFSWSGSLLVERWQRGRAALNQHLFKVVERDGVSRTWLTYVLRSALDRLSQMTHGTTMKHITKKTLARVAVELPPQSEQEAIGARLEAAESLLCHLRSHETRVSSVCESVAHTLISGDHEIPDSYDRFLAPVT